MSSSEAQDKQEAQDRQIELQAEVEEMANKLLRLQADFENYRKRTARARVEAYDDGKREMLLGLLPIYDNFVRALDQAEQTPELLQFLHGFELIGQQLDQFLKEQGLEEIPARIGQIFDPHVHEATGTVAGQAEEQQGTISQELQKGFAYKGLVVRPSRVLVFE